MNLPWFTPKPIKIGDVYPLDDVGDYNRSVRIIKEVQWDWPKWVKFEARYLDEDGKDTPWTDFTGGRGFVNSWGPTLIRTRWELLSYTLKRWVWGKRKLLANRIYPRD